MAIGTVTRVTGGDAGANPATPTFTDLISFAGDAAYPTGGTTGFEATFRAVSGLQGRQVLSLVATGACGGYTPRYDEANDTLMVFECGADGDPFDEVANATNLSGVTFKVAVTSV
jgi:hypothetical protein